MPLYEHVFLARQDISTAQVDAMIKEYSQVIMSYLFERLRNCRTKSLPQYAESVFCAIKEEHREEYLRILRKRNDALSPAKQKRVARLIRSL